MNYPRIYERVYCGIHAITQERFNAIHEVVFPRLSAGSDHSIEALLVTAEQNTFRENKNPYSGKRAQRAGAALMPDGSIDKNFFSMAKPGVAVVPVYGVLAKNLSAYEESCGGGTDIAAPAHALQQAVAAASVEKIVLDFDSPGGNVVGITEFAAEIRAAAAVKPVYAFSDNSCYSAGYWLASQAGECYGTPSSGWGSIGVITARLDRTIALQLAGLKVETFSAGKYKAEGAVGSPLSDEARARIQGMVDHHYGQFTADIQAARQTVGIEAMQGQYFTAAEALENNLIDGLVDGWDAFLALI